MNNLRNTVITGGRGFIGVNLAESMRTARNVKVYDNLQRPSPTGWVEEHQSFICGDILNLPLLESELSGNSEVVHLAAYGSVVESISDPRSNFLVNVNGTLNVLQAAAKAGVRRVIMASTGGALIGDALPPVDENSLPKPISPYGASKLCGEAYCHAFAKSYGLETICLRFGNVYGPHSAHKKGAVTVFIKALMRDEPIVIYGDGSASRDYIYVDDLCRGINGALDADNIGAEVFHLASMRETTVLELANILCGIAGKPNHLIQFRPARTGEVSRNFASYTKARHTLGFEPKVALDEGLEKTWEWYCKQDPSILAAETTDS